MQLKFTAPMKQRLTRLTHEKIERALGHFPELKDSAITVGYTRKHLGSATVIYRKGSLLRLIVRLRARKVTYQTIGHELTHLVQGLAYGARSTDPKKIPSGEKQCDIWTLARDPLFCDDPPTYIKMPRAVRERWPDFAKSVRDLCVAAIEKRPNHRHYIHWLEAEIGKLAKTAPRRQTTAPRQLVFPFGRESCP